MADRQSNIDYSEIRGRINVPCYDGNLHDRREAAWFLELGYRVTDGYGRDLIVVTSPKGIRRVAIGEDTFAAYNERIAVAAERGRVGKDSGGRPLDLLERELTDYEAGRKHPEESGVVNCDHPVHFGGDAYGTGCIMLGLGHATVAKCALTEYRRQAQVRVCYGRPGVREGRSSKEEEGW